MPLSNACHWWQDEDGKREEKEDRGEDAGLLGGVKLRSTGLANNLKSPTNGFSRSKSPNNRISNQTAQSEPDRGGESGSLIDCDTFP